MQEVKQGPLLDMWPPVGEPAGLGITTAPSDIFESPSRVGGWRELTPCLRVANGFFFLLGQDTPITHVKKLGDSYVRI